MQKSTLHCLEHIELAPVASQQQIGKLVRIKGRMNAEKYIEVHEDNLPQKV